MPFSHWCFRESKIISYLKWSLLLYLLFTYLILGPAHVQSYLALSISIFLSFLTNTTIFDQIYVRMPRTQPGNVGKFLVLLVVLIFLLSQQLIQNNNCVLGVCTYFLSKFVVFVENDTKLKSTMPSLCAIEYSELKTESVLASPTNQRPGFQNSFNSQFTLFNCTWAALWNGANRGLNVMVHVHIV